MDEVLYPQIITTTTYFIFKKMILIVCFLYHAELHSAYCISETNFKWNNFFYISLIHFQ